MLTVTCQNDSGQALAETYHVHPTSLWPTIQSVYAAYYGIDPSSLSINHNGQVFSMGLMPLGWVRIANTIRFDDTTMDVISENNYGEDHPAGSINKQGNVVLN